MMIENEKAAKTMRAEKSRENDNEPNIPGPRELPDQQKVGEPDDNQRRTPKPRKGFSEARKEGAKVSKQK